MPMYLWGEGTRQRERERAGESTGCCGCFLGDEEVARGLAWQPPLGHGPGELAETQNLFRRLLCSLDSVFQDSSGHPLSETQNRGLPWRGPFNPPPSFTVRHPNFGGYPLEKRPIYHEKKGIFKTGYPFFHFLKNNNFSASDSNMRHIQFLV